MFKTIRISYDIDANFFNLFVLYLWYDTTDFAAFAQTRPIFNWEIQLLSVYDRRPILFTSTERHWGRFLNRWKVILKFVLEIIRSAQNGHDGVFEFNSDKRQKRNEPGYHSVIILNFLKVVSRTIKRGHRGYPLFGSRPSNRITGYRVVRAHGIDYTFLNYRVYIYIYIYIATFSGISECPPIFTADLLTVSSDCKWIY